MIDPNTPTLVFPAVNWTDPSLLLTIGGALLALALAAVIWGILTMRLARHKGYRGYFWTGFFLWTVGLIYVVGLPLSDEKRLMDMKKQVQITIRAGLKQER